MKPDNNSGAVKPFIEEQRETCNKIDVMAAYVQGKKIQVSWHGGGGWVDSACPVWTWDICDFRIKPEDPRSWFIAVLPGAPAVGLAVGYAYNTREEAELRGGMQCEIVEVVEKVVGGEK